MLTVRTLTKPLSPAIQSAIDLVGYAAGQTDEFRGTGVWSGVKMKRETPEEPSGQATKPAEKPKEKVPQ